MLMPAQIQPGVLIRHTISNSVYVVASMGKLRLLDGTWVEAARYEKGNSQEEFYRALTDFTHFELAGD